MAAAQYGGVRRRQAAERGERVLGADLLYDADGGVEDDDDQDDREVGEVAQARGEDRGRDQEQDHRIPQLDEDP